METVLKSFLVAISRNARIYFTVYGLPYDVVNEPSVHPHCTDCPFWGRFDFAD